MKIHDQFIPVLFILLTSTLNAQNQYCLSFDGVDDYTETPTSTAYQDVVDSISICAWIKLESLPPDGESTVVARRDFVGNPAGERHHFQLLIRENLGIGFSSSNNVNDDLYTTQLNTDANVIALQEWVHIAVTFQNGFLIFYKNGVEIESYDFGYKELYPNNHWINMGIVHRSGGNAFFSEFHGKIDEVNIWHEVLDASKINQVMRGNDIAGPNLLSYWNFEEGSGTTIVDSSGLTEDGSLFAGTSWSTDVHPIVLDDRNRIGMQVDSSNVFVNSAGLNGIILKDENGGCWKITVNTSGNIVTDAVVCPEED